MSFPTKVEVRPLDRFNWTEFLDLQPADHQKAFIPSVLHAIAESKFDACTPMGIWLDGVPVGFIQSCNFNRTCWITRVLIDWAYQRRGIGKEAVLQVIQLLRTRDCAEIRTSVHRDNLAAIDFFGQLGFRPIGQDEWEVVMKFES